MDHFFPDGWGSGFGLGCKSDFSSGALRTRTDEIVILSKTSKDGQATSTAGWGMLSLHSWITNYHIFLFPKIQMQPNCFFRFFFCISSSRSTGFSSSFQSTTPEPHGLVSFIWSPTNLWYIVIMAARKPLNSRPRSRYFAPVDHSSPCSCFGVIATTPNHNDTRGRSLRRSPPPSGTSSSSRTPSPG